MAMDNDDQIESSMVISESPAKTSLRATFRLLVPANVSIMFDIMKFKNIPINRQFRGGCHCPFCLELKKNQKRTRSKNKTKRAKQT